ncbi:NAD binding domain of 6-phosphogluconate dehydrogenase [Ceratobasidium sp. AG-Ba]|nr:NAD binding domain of 6-phosphogluconate dehydrogenase [Ceratobasidium sp. AG-Ba]
MFRSGPKTFIMTYAIAGKTNAGTIKRWSIRRSERLKNCCRLGDLPRTSFHRDLGDGHWYINHPSPAVPPTRPFYQIHSTMAHLTPHPSGTSTPRTHAAQLREQLPYSRPGTPQPHPNAVGFIGLGNMGYLMARNLAKHAEHPPLLVYNRSRAKAEQLQKEVGESKVKIIDTPGELATLADITFTSLGSDDVVRSIYHDIAQTLDATQKSGSPEKPKIFVDTSTVYPKVSVEVDRLLSKIPHTHFVAGPVFGPPAAADKALLISALAGHYKSKKEVAYLLVPAVSRKVIDLGGNVEKAASMKLIGNAFILGSLELIAETQTLADKSGVGAEQVDAFINDMFPVPLLINYSKKMLNDSFDGNQGFHLEGGLKDANHILRLSQDSNSPMPVITTARDHMLTARAQEKKPFKSLDWSSLVSGNRLAAGLDAFDHRKHQNKPEKEDD